MCVTAKESKRYFVIPEQRAANWSFDCIQKNKKTNKAEI